MAVITLNDLPINRALDHQAMASIRGAGGAPWVFGAFRPFVRAIPSAVVPVMNLFQTENNFYQIDNSVHLDQSVNQYQTVQINNSGNSATINAVLVGSLNH
ncbi:MAG: hypothetical protein ACKVQT_25995 [Burkholderiales bacterium]